LEFFTAFLQCVIIYGYALYETITPIGTPKAISCCGLNLKTKGQINMNSLARWQRPEFSAWTGFGRLTNLREEIDRLFEAPLAELARSSQLLSGWNPAFDVYEDKDNLYVRAELAGMRKEDIDISLHNGSLSISGERKADESLKEAEVYRAERFFGRFQRTITLPTPVSVNKIKAQYKDGVLTVTLPKAEEAKPRHIDVTVS
jgi:HSP20 family protein